MSEVISKTEYKKDEGKTPWNLIPLNVIAEIAKVLGFGANKYAANAWRSPEDEPDARERIWAALFRHLEAYQSGEFRAPDSKLPHLAHAMCNLMFLLFFDLRAKR